MTAEPYDETIHRAILACYASQSLPTQIVAHLQSLRQLLRHDLGIDPSPETLTLVAALLR